LLLFRQINATPLWQALVITPLKTNNFIVVCTIDQYVGSNDCTVMTLLCFNSWFENLTLVTSLNAKDLRQLLRQTIFEDIRGKNLPNASCVL
jgi:hypothetical protein